MNLSDHHPALARFLREHGDHRPGAPPVAVFDCDGTVISGDIGEAMFYRQIEEFRFRVPPGELWPDNPLRGDISAMYRELLRLPPAERGASRIFGRFAELLLAWYFDQLSEGLIAKGCADIVRLLAGHTPAEVREMADRCLAAETSASPGERLLGRRPVRTGVRFLREPRLLLEELRRHGFEIWAVSGSNRWSVEPVFRRLGVPPERVVGIDLETRDGLLANQVRTPIPVAGGKVEALRALLPSPPLLVASDSRTDLPLLRHSAGLRVLVNSHPRPPEAFFTGGRVKRDDSWLVIDHPEREG